MKRVARVFPRKTKASPTDTLAFFDGPGLFPPIVEVVHVSVAFTWDLSRAEELAGEWERVASVKFGGPAFGLPGGEFEPGMYLRWGYIITSRGCPNSCWFCSVWRREGHTVRELPIREGWNVLDDNLLACTEEHIRSVFAMLKRQPHRAEFTGGLEAARLKDWHIDLLTDLKPQQIFFAYDTKDDFDPLREAAKKLKEAGFDRQTLRCYVLCGYDNDTFGRAECRMYQVATLGMFPMAMLYRDKGDTRDPSWMKFQKIWARPASIYAKLKDEQSHPHLFREVETVRTPGERRGR